MIARGLPSYVPYNYCDQFDMVSTFTKESNMVGILPLWVVCLCEMKIWLGYLNWKWEGNYSVIDIWVINLDKVIVVKPLFWDVRIWSEKYQ